MPSSVQIGKETKDLDLIADLLFINEAVVNQWCGKIRTGKTYGATVDAIEALNRGEVVYTSWFINWQGYDERSSWWKLQLAKYGLKKNFKVFPKENYHYLPYTSKDLSVYAPFTNFEDKFYSITDARVYLDEAQAILNSYEKTNLSQEKQNSILYTGHLNRSINIISQRAAQIHTVMRANISRWYIMSKEQTIFGLVFTRKEYQEADGNNLPNIDLEPEEEISYHANKKIYAMYDSKYMRGDMPDSQKNYSKIYELTKDDIALALTKLKLDRGEGEGVDLSHEIERS